MAASLIFSALRISSRTFCRRIRIGVTPRNRRISEQISPFSSNSYHKSFRPSWRYSCLASVSLLSFFKLKKDEQTMEEKADAYEEGKESVDASDDIVYHVYLARTAQRNKDYPEADRQYHIALRMASKKHHSGEISEKLHLQSIAYIYDGLANLALIQGEYDKAEDLYKETMRGHLQLGGEKNDNVMMELTVKLSSIYAMTKKEDLAFLGLKTVIETQESKVKADPDSDSDTYGLLGIALQTYGRLLLHHKELDKAEAAFGRCEEISIHAAGENSAQRLHILNDLAAVQILRKDYEQAEETLQKALIVGKAIQSPDICALYSNMGAISLRLSKLDMAESRCKSALDLALKANNDFAQGQAKFCLQKVNEARKKK